MKTGIPLRHRIAPALVALAAVSLLGAAAAQQANTADLQLDTFHPATHSHNDYYQDRPLLDALESGMGSIEADIFYVELPFLDADGEERALRELYIAHDWEEIEGNVPGFGRTKGTLAELYLDPLWEIYLQNDGEIYPGGTLLLHADMKTETETTWRVLENTLRNYPGLFTTFDLETREVTPGPVTVYTNEEPSAEFLAEYGTVHSTADGRFGDIFDPVSWESETYTDRNWRMPIISSNFQAYMDVQQMFEVQGEISEIVAEYSDEFPELTEENFWDELDSDLWALANRLIEDGRMTVSEYLPERLAEANRLGQEGDHLIRFWASPDAEWFWEMVAPLEQVVILTDHPQEVDEFLSSGEAAQAHSEEPQAAQDDPEEQGDEEQEDAQAD